jgi:hypothetical protein
MMKQSKKQVRSLKTWVFRLVLLATVRYTPSTQVRTSFTQRSQIIKAPRNGCFYYLAPREEVPNGTSGRIRKTQRCRRRASWGREHLVDYERSEIIYLVIRDRIRSLPILSSGFAPQEYFHFYIPSSH